MQADVDETLAQILTLVLGSAVAPSENLVREEEAGWDSLKHLEIIMAVEAAFDVAFSVDEMAAVIDVAGLKAKVLRPDAA